MNIIKIAQNSDSVWVDAKGALVWSKDDIQYGMLGEEDWKRLKRHPSFNKLGEEIHVRNGFRFHTPFHELKEGIKGKTREDMITTTKDMEFLRKVLSREEDDYATCFAVMNPLCPKEILESLANNPEMEMVIQYIAKSPNCPPKILDDIISHDFNNWAAVEAVRNPNFSSENIVKLLNHGTRHNICYEAVRNPNCPLEAKLKWLEDTGQIHQGPEEPKKEKYNKSDADLEELSNLFN